MTAVDHARYRMVRLAAQLRKLRTESTLTGAELGARTGISQSKISKLETAASLPTPDDVKAIADAFGLSGSCRHDLHALAKQCVADSAVPRVMLYRGPHRQLTHLAQASHTAPHVTVLSTTILPWGLQCEEYHLAANGPLDAYSRATALGELTARQAPLLNGRQTAEFVMCEGAMRTVVGSLAVMAMQLHHLTRLTAAVPTIRIRLVPFDAALSPPPAHGVDLYDEFATIAMETGVAVIRAPEDLRVYRDIMNRLRFAALSVEQTQAHLTMLAQDYTDRAERAS